jgi:hypothetical protein
MNYKCDICSYLMPSKESGTFFDQNRVSTSPGYWEYMIQGASSTISEDTIGMYAQMCSLSRSGFVVCNNCKTMLNNDFIKYTDLGLERYIESIPSGNVEPYAILVVAGTIFKKHHGKWPATLQPEPASPKKPSLPIQSTTVAPKKQQSKTQTKAILWKKWWQFWK